MRIILMCLLCGVILTGCRSAAEKAEAEQELANIKASVKEFCASNKSTFQADIVKFMAENDYDYMTSIKTYSPKKAVMLVWKIGGSKVVRAHVVKENNTYKVVKLETVENDFIFNP